MLFIIIINYKTFTLLLCVFKKLYYLLILKITKKIEIMKEIKINIEVKHNVVLPLKHILVWNYDYGNFIEVIYHYITYKNDEKRGIGQWNIKLK